jgi:hypothetical protein
MYFKASRPNKKNQLINMNLSYGTVGRHKSYLDLAPVLIPFVLQPLYFPPEFYQLVL